MEHPISNFCGSEFWNINKTWYTDDPDFTPCFENTVLVWVPCIFLLVCSPFDVHYMRVSLNRNIPWSVLSISKLVLTAALVTLSVIDLGYAISSQDTISIYPVDLYTPVIKIAAFLYSALILYYNKKLGQRTSGLLFLFWFLFAVFSIPRCRTEVRHKATRDLELSEPDPWLDYKYASYMIFFTLTLANLFLNCFGDKRPRDTKYPKTEKESPELGGGFLNKLFYWWYNKLSWTGFRKPLTIEDLYDMRPQDATIEIMPVFEKHWNKAIGKKDPKTPMYQNGAATAEFKKNSGSISFTHKPQKEPLKKASILIPMAKTFGGIYLFGSFLKIVIDVMTFISPQVLSLMISYVESYSTAEPQPKWKGVLYALLLFGTGLTTTLIQSQYMERMFVTGLRIRAALTGAIYKKALIISNNARKTSTVGEIVNLMAVDCQRFMELMNFLNMLWSAPLQIALSMYFLWQQLGPSVLAGLAVMFLLIPINGYLANKSKLLQVKQMKNKDKRVKMMNEILGGMKVLKLYAWEPSFEKLVGEIRDKEIQVLKQTAYLQATTQFIWSCAPFLVSLLTFATYVLVDETHVLDATKAFVSLSLFNILRMPMAMLPNLISNIIQTQVSINRINHFMNNEELDPENVQHDPKESSALLIENGSFSWGEEELVLKNINIEVKNKELVAIVGSVGSGKSTLVSAFLGETEKISGRVNTLGSIAYVPQQAWIQNSTLRDNILFGQPYDKRRYEQVIEACALKPDIAMLTGGDATEIGEKGINLSGGQKQRISLARAVYSEADTYMFDDPLSAVDSHVGKHIFDQVIGPKGLLASKTRLLVTHGITFLPHVNRIYVLKDGEISENGTYQELLNQKGAFADFLLEHISEAVGEEDELEEIQKQVESTVQSDELKIKLQRAISRRKSETNSADKVSLNGSIGGGEDKGPRRRSTASRQASVVDTQKEQNHQKSKAGRNKLIEMEKAETGNVKFAVFKHYAVSIGIFVALLTIALLLLCQGFSVGSNLWLSQWATDPNSSDSAVRDMYLGVYGAFGIGQVVCQFISSLSLALGCLKAAKKMHAALLSYVMRWPLGTFDITPLGRILNRFSKDIDSLDNTLPMMLRAMMSQFLTVLGTIIVICISTPIFIAVIVPISVVYYGAQRYYVASARQLMRLESITRSPIYSHFGETVSGTATIRAYSAQDRFIAESNKKVDLNQVCKYPSIIANRWISVRLEFLGSLIILSAALFAVLGGQTNAGLVGLSISYSLQITQSLNWLVRMLSEIETNIVAVERIKEYGEVTQEASWNEDKVKVSQSWPQSGKVEFQDYQVRYREGLDLVLNGVNFTVEGGEKIGIVGRTGAGKSSLTLALFRIIEAANGRILIDDVDVAQLGLHSLRSRLTIIPQDPVLFSGSLRMNLDPFEQQTDEQLWTALEHAHLKGFVKGLAAGLNHEVSEGGENLSVGQRQLVCLARALLRKTKVLILDEATAAVDLETDDLIQKTIRVEFKDCTVLTIAHRLNTILDSNRVMVLDKGRIAEFASPAELLENTNSIFHSMAKDAGLA